MSRTVAITFIGVVSLFISFLVLKKNDSNLLIERSGKIKFSRDTDNSKPIQVQTCQFGFDFLETMDKEQSRTAQRRLLPEHSNQNFSGALVGQDLMCLDTMDATENQWIGIFECHGQGRNQGVTFTTDGFIVSGATVPLCLSIKNMISTSVVLKKCNKQDDTQMWTTDSTKGYIIPTARKEFCLNSPKDENDYLVIDRCRLNQPEQRWQLVMNEVLALWVDDTFHVDRHKLRRKSTRKQMKKLILHHAKVKPVNEDEGLDFI